LYNYLPPIFHFKNKPTHCTVVQAIQPTAFNFYYYYPSVYQQSPDSARTLHCSQYKQ